MVPSISPAGSRMFSLQREVSVEAPRIYVQCQYLTETFPSYLLGAENSPSHCAPQRFQRTVVRQVRKLDYRTSQNRYLGCGGGHGS